LPPRVSPTLVTPLCSIVHIVTHVFSGSKKFVSTHIGFSLAVCVCVSASTMATRIVTQKRVTCVNYSRIFIDFFTANLLQSVMVEEF